MDEYISREAVLKAFRITAKNSNKDYQRGLQDAIDCLVPEVIADIPTADVQPAKHGKWKFTEKLILGNHLGSYQCSECMYRVPCEENYCPNCGADMRNKEG